MDTVLEKVLSEVLDMREDIVALRRRLHACPEVGSTLPQTCTLVREELARMGCQAEEIVPGGLTTLIQGERPGKTLLLRADMDALPMTEESGLPFAAGGGKAHTCGHDIHTAALLGAAHMLMKQRNRLHGKVRLMFQPAEETMEGAAAMIGAGILRDVDGAFALHVAPEQPVGWFQCCGGYIMASSDLFAVTVEGEGGHGAVPHRCVDPITAAVAIHTAFQTIISRECSPAGSNVLTIGSFQAGAAGNLLPQAATMLGTTRSASLEERDFIIGRMEDYVQGIAKAHRARGKLEVLASVPPLYNHPEMAAAMAGHLRQALSGNCQVSEAWEYRAVSEDFSLVAAQVPSVYVRVGAGQAGGSAYGVHHPKVIFDEAVLPLGAAVYCACAMGWLTGEGARE